MYASFIFLFHIMGPRLSSYHCFSLVRYLINSITGTMPSELCALSNTFIYYDESEIFCTCIRNNYIEGTRCN